MRSDLPVPRTPGDDCSVIVIGVRSHVRTLGIISVICERCGNPASHRIARRTRRFVLFFVPLLPVSRSWGMTCTYCGQATTLSHERVEELLAGAASRPVPQIAHARPRRP